MKGLSMFASAGIGETYLSDCGIDIIVANELIDKRANLYRAINPNSNMICGDITDTNIFNMVMNAAKDIDFLIASPPCQGMSVAGKNRCVDSMINDKRNFLMYSVINAINILKPKYVLIENVPMLLKLTLPYKDGIYSILDILDMEFSNSYSISHKVVDAADYGVPQTRLRAIIKLYPKDEIWDWPQPISKKLTVKDTIGHLPSLEAGERSNIKWHFARNHNEKHILWMKNTPTGKSAFSNQIYYPKKEDGTKIKGYESSYRRIKWDEPAPTITIRNDAISSQRNVHPGRKLITGEYSDARVLTPYELMLLNSLPPNWNIPDNTPELLIRQVIGESIPPLMIKKIIEKLNVNK